MCFGDYFNDCTCGCTTLHVICACSRRSNRTRTVDPLTRNRKIDEYQRHCLHNQWQRARNSIFLIGKRVYLMGKQRFLGFRVARCVDASFMIKGRRSAKCVRINHPNVLRDHRNECTRELQQPQSSHSRSDNCIPHIIHKHMRAIILAVMCCVWCG